MAQKPSIPKGTRDFGFQEMARRNYIFDTIRSVFRTYGYSQIETPAMENLGTLLGKYGDEGDKLLWKHLIGSPGDEEFRLYDRYCSEAMGLYLQRIYRHYPDWNRPVQHWLSEVQPLWP